MRLLKIAAGVLFGLFIWVAFWRVMAAVDWYSKTNMVVLGILILLGIAMTNWYEYRHKIGPYKDRR